MPATTERIIKELWVWVGTDHLRNEGVICRVIPISLELDPFLADTRELLDGYADEVRQIAAEMRLTLKAAKFVRAEE